ncbi:MAG: hypothetical protein ACREJ5_08495 [Geminicoccaceae bacterium]
MRLGSGRVRLITTNIHGGCTFDVPLDALLRDSQGWGRPPG